MTSRRTHPARAAAVALALAAAATLAGACDTTYDFDGTTVGEDDGTGALRSRTSLQFVRGLYADLVGRSPERYDFAVSVNGTAAFSFPIDEEQLLVASLDAVGDPAPMRALIVKGLVRSAEVTLPAKGSVADPAGFIRDQFRRLLGREPNTYELAGFVREWQADPAVGPAAVIRALAGSREYQGQ